MTSPCPGSAFYTSTGTLGSSQCPGAAFFDLDGNSELFTVPGCGFFWHRRALWALHSARARLFLALTGTLDFSQCPGAAFFDLDGHSGLFTVPGRGFFWHRWALWTLHSARARLFLTSTGTLNSSQCPGATFFGIDGHSGLFTVPGCGFFWHRRALWTLHSARVRLFLASTGTLDSPQCPGAAFFGIDGHSGLFTMPKRGFF